jgi:hypothetical protein
MREFEPVSVGEQQECGKIYGKERSRDTPADHKIERDQAGQKEYRGHGNRLAYSSGLEDAKAKRMLLDKMVHPGRDNLPGAKNTLSGNASGNMGEHCI